MRRPEFHCLGPVVLDRVIEVDRIPGPDDKAFVTAATTPAGGPARNVAFALAGWGERVTAAAVVGDDVVGQRLLDRLSEAGVGTESVERLPDLATASCTIIVDAAGERAILIDPVEDAVLARIGSGVRPLAGDAVLSNLFHDHATVDALTRARAAGALAFVDLEWPEIGRWGWAAAARAAAAADVAVTNRQVLKGFSDGRGIAPTAPPPRPWPGASSPPADASASPSAPTACSPARATVSIAWSGPRHPEEHDGRRRPLSRRPRPRPHRRPFLRAVAGPWSRRRRHPSRRHRRRLGRRGADRRHRDRHRPLRRRSRLKNVPRGHRPRLRGGLPRRRARRRHRSHAPGRDRRGLRRPRRRPRAGAAQGPLRGRSRARPPDRRCHADACHGAPDHRRGRPSDDRRRRRRHARLGGRGRRVRPLRRTDHPCRGRAIEGRRRSGRRRQSAVYSCMFGTSNGGAMRAPAAGCARPGRPEDAAKLAAILSAPTHNTQIAFGGAGAVAAAIAAGLGGSGIDAMEAAALLGARVGEAEAAAWGRIVGGAGVIRRIDMALAIGRRHAGDVHAAAAELTDVVGNGVAMAEAVPHAFGLVAAARGNAWQSILGAVNGGNDSDTIAMIAGAVAAATNPPKAGRPTSSTRSDPQQLDLAALAAALADLRDARAADHAPILDGPHHPRCRRAPRRHRRHSPVTAVEQHGPHLPSARTPSSTGACSRASSTSCRTRPRRSSCRADHRRLGRAPRFPRQPSAVAGPAARDLDRRDRLRGAGRHPAVLIFNSHGGQAGFLAHAALDLRVRLGLFVAYASWFDAGFPDGLFTPDEIAYGLHGGAIETSLMLHLHPISCAGPRSPISSRSHPRSRPRPVRSPPFRATAARGLRLEGPGPARQRRHRNAAAASAETGRRLWSTSLSASSTHLRSRQGRRPRHPLHPPLMPATRTHEAMLMHQLLELSAETRAGPDRLSLGGPPPHPHLFRSRLGHGGDGGRAGQPRGRSRRPRLVFAHNGLDYLWPCSARGGSAPSRPS